MITKTALKKGAQTWAGTLEVLCKLAQPPRRILLFGPPGTGKTTWAMSLSKGAERITLTEGMFPDALLGKYLLRDGNTVWVDGPAVRAARKGVPLVLDEINRGGKELDSTLQAILDDETICCLNLDNGETVTPAKGFRIIATMNGRPDELSPAVLDRFDIPLHCKTPSQGLLDRLDKDAALFIDNKMKNDPNPDEHWQPDITPRRMLSFCNLRSEIDATIAGEIIFGKAQGTVIVTALIDAQRNAGKGKQEELL